MLTIGDEGGSGKCQPLLTRGVWKPPNLAGVICEQPLIKNVKTVSDCARKYIQNPDCDYYKWKVTQTQSQFILSLISHIYICQTHNQEDKQFNADPIHPKEELVDWTQKLITCYITIPSIPMKDISSFHVCLVSEKFSKFANDDLSFSILRLAVAAEWGMNKDIGFKMDAYCIYACACNIMLLVILLGAHSRGSSAAADSLHFDSW